MTKVVICYTQITPRLVRRIQCFAERVPDVIVLEIAGSQSVYPWWRGRHDVGTVRQVQLFEQPLEELSHSRIVRAAKAFLEREEPDVAIGPDYSYQFMRFIARWVKQHGGRNILLNVSWSGDHRRWAIKERVKSWVVRRLFDAVCASGERAQAYSRGLGFSSKQIWKQFNVVDNEHFSTGAERARNNAPALRKEFGLPEAHFLFMGAFEPWKNVPHLLDCYTRYRESGGLWGLVLVGTGSQLESLQTKAKQEQVPGLVFTGMKNHSETPSYLGLASCLVIPSLSEPWGLVINEAEAAGLPILASHRCGCVPELVHRGINGYVFEPTDRQHLVQLMHLISGRSLDLVAMGQSSRKIIQYYTPERWADALADCVRYLRLA
jgi:1,2-diacylglycerol 3-alpha-glucosyltransferase